MSKNWTYEEDLKLQAMIKDTRLNTEQMAKELNRSFKSVMHRRMKLNKGVEKVEYKNEEKQLSQKEISKVIVASLKEQLESAEPYKILKSEVKKGDTLVIHLTDLHAGKVVKDQEGKVIFDEVVFRTRIDRLCEQILKLLDNNIAKGVAISDVVILSTGDLCNGEGIYATQAYEQEIAPPKQVMLIVEVLQKLILSLLDRKLNVQFAGVRGNHGRTGKDTDVTSNWDLMVYLVLDFWARLVLKNPKLTIKFSESEHMVLNIRGNGYLIRHIAPEQCDSPAGRAKINEWARKHNVKAVVYGHWHHIGLFDVDGIRVFRGGSLPGGDDLSESMGKHSEPMQGIWGVREERAMTFFYSVDLNEYKEK